MFHGDPLSVVAAALNAGWGGAHTETPSSAGLRVPGVLLFWGWAKGISVGIYGRLGAVSRDWTTLCALNPKTDTVPRRRQPLKCAAYPPLVPAAGGRSAAPGPLQPLSSPLPAPLLSPWVSQSSGFTFPLLTP